MNQEKTGFEKIIDFSKLQISKSKILGRLMFRSAKLENERKQILEKIAEHFCEKYNSKSADFQVPDQLVALFERQAEILNQLQSHYQEIDVRSRENTFDLEQPPKDNKG